jgi:crotonobetainyl-CoA:carnitine CoA-transferase CaiB-like acyl-CoA transferase
VYTAQDICEDPHFQQLGTIQRVQDPDFGTIAMQGPLFRLSGGQPATRHTGRAPGADTDEVLGELGVGAAELAALREAGVIA